MINKKFLNKLNLCLVIMCALFIFIPNRVTAAINLNVKQMEHRNNVKTDRVWNIKFNQGICEDKLTAGVVVYSPLGEIVGTKISYDPINNIVKIEPPVAGYKAGQTYSLQINDNIKDLYSNSMKAPVIMNFTIEAADTEPVSNSNKEYIANEYDTTLNQIVDMQSKFKPVNVVMNYDLKPSNLDIYEYMNPKNFKNHNYAVYQFLKLDSYTVGITAEALNSYLKGGLGNGVLNNQGETFLKAASENNINVAYLTAHTMLETGHGKSNLSKGIMVSEVDGIQVAPRLTYNMFGIGATDIAPDKNGSEYAYRNGWFTVEDAIMGGAKFISDEYINNVARKQNTLYKMRWDPANLGSVATHQYATDIAWAYKISYTTREIQDKDINANLKFEIPQYK
ncbi:glucosaminidase domain-containing protein [Clostridium estertheticum]|uniref:N-acetylglucosaminidase n=1 Tax=Clostridium estertheticum TaxID=238834 RepID=UPI0013E92064|nr:glucosaminidase domain-containing protein [Clostridium estertheticum]MBZ9684923.1 glucosaminidase domain-containing protein [Clostridium estertheticum]